MIVQDVYRNEHDRNMVYCVVVYNEVLNTYRPLSFSFGPAPNLKRCPLFINNSRGSGLGLGIDVSTLLDSWHQWHVILKQVGLIIMQMMSARALLN